MRGAGGAGGRAPPAGATSLERRSIAACWVLLGIGLALFVARNLSDQGIWYDEAVQLFISVGEHPFGPLGQPARGLRGVHAANGASNLDPGGFSVLLFGWLTLSDEVAWARVLPLLFLGLAAAAAVALGRRWSAGPGSSPWVPLGGAALLLLDPLVRFESLEIRAYTMELAGVIATVWALDRYLERRTLGNAMLAGAAMSLAAVARYSGLFVVFAAAVTLLVASARERAAAGADGDGGRTGAGRGPRGLGETTGAPGRVARSIAIVRSVLPVLALPAAAGVAIAVLSGRQFVGRITYRSGELVGYLKPHLAADSETSALAARVASNLFGVYGLPLTLASAIVGFTLVRAASGRGGGGSVGFLERLQDRRSMLVFATACGTLVVSIALWRFHPWDLQQKWSLYLHALSVLCVVRLLAIAPATGAWRRIVAGVVVLATVVGAVELGRELRRHPQAVVEALAFLGERHDDLGPVAVDVHAFPPLRYLCERSSLAERPALSGRSRPAGCERYPQGFVLPLPLGVDPLVEHSGLAISVADLESLRARLAPIPVESTVESAVESAGLPVHLFRIGGAPGPRDL